MLKNKWNKLYQHGHRVAWRAVTGIYLFCLRKSGKLPPAQSDQPDRNKKTIYLTFDDGPNKDTERLLNILERYHVKATFFVVSTSPFLSVLKKTAAMGHTIGNHTANHVYKELYKSEASFFDALYRAERMIEAQTGIRTSLMRFPGGSISIRHHTKEPHLDLTLTHKLKDRGYHYVDWNVCGMDAAGARTSMEVYKNVIQGVRNRETSVVLLHDIKRYTVDAVEMILVWGLRNGYVFLPMDETSPMAHHKLT